MSARAFWYVAATKKSAKNTLYMHCNVKPGASKNREGVLSVNDEAVELCVAAQAREGEANKAVIKVLSEVCILQFLPNSLPLITVPGSRPPQVRPANYPRPQVAEQDCCCRWILGQRRRGGVPEPGSGVPRQGHG